MIKGLTHSGAVAFEHPVIDHGEVTNQVKHAVAGFLPVSRRSWITLYQDAFRNRSVYQLAG
jgi:hypothetical protein